MSGRMALGLIPAALRVASAACCAGALRPAVRGMPAFVWQLGGGDRGMAVGKRGVPKQRREVIKDQESRQRRKEHAREAKARNATDMDRHVMQAYKVSFSPALLVCVAVPALFHTWLDHVLRAGAGVRRGSQPKMKEAPKICSIPRQLCTYCAISSLHHPSCIHPHSLGDALWSGLLTIY